MGSSEGGSAGRDPACSGDEPFDNNDDGDGIDFFRMDVYCHLIDAVFSCLSVSVNSGVFTHTVW